MKPFQKISSRDRQIILADSFATFFARAEELKRKIRRAQALLDASLKADKRELFELRARIESIEREALK